MSTTCGQGVTHVGGELAISLRFMEKHGKVLRRRSRCDCDACE